MKKYLVLLAAIVASTTAFGQKYPSPIFDAINVQGMVCDNVTNDAPAYQAALNAGVGRLLLLPKNAQCRIKSYVGYPNHTHVVGQNTTLNFDAAATGGGSLNLTMMIDGTDDVTIEGVIFNGPGVAATNTTPRFMFANGTSNLKLYRNTFQNFGNTTNNTTRANTYAQGFAGFGLTNGIIRDNKFLNNSGDGLAFSNNSNHVRIEDNFFSGNWDSAVIPCTVGGNDVVVTENIINHTNFANPVIGTERCQQIVIRDNIVTGIAGQNCIRVARYADTADFNQDVKITGNTCLGGSNISVENSGTTQGLASVPKGGLIKVANNVVISPSGSGITIVDSSNSEVIGNTITGAGAEGIVEQSFNYQTGNNIISNNRVDGATRCYRQFQNAGTGSIITSYYSGNLASNCSVTPWDLLANAGTDGPAVTISLTGSVTNGGTMPTYTATRRQKKIEDRLWSLEFTISVSNVGSAPSSAFYNFPMGLTAASSTTCSFVNSTLGTISGIGGAVVNSGATIAVLNISSLSTQSYSFSCRIESSS